MLTIIIGILIVVSIGVLVAHAIDAFRSDKHPNKQRLPGQNDQRTSLSYWRGIGRFFGKGICTVIAGLSVRANAS